MTIVPAMTLMMSRIMSKIGMRMTKRMRMMRRGLSMAVAAVTVAACVWSATAVLAQQPSTPRPPAATDEFVPIDQIPEHDKLPAAPFLIGSYTVVWLLVLIYVWSLWRRLSRVEDELKRLAPGSSKS